MKNSNILITWVSGFIGANLIEYFLPNNNLLSIDIKESKIKNDKSIYKNIEMWKLIWKKNEGNI